MLLVVASACGRYQFGQLDDAAADTPLGDFGAPQRIPALSDPLTDDDPTATADALEPQPDDSGL